jgi:hypothetical protein
MLLTIAANEIGQLRSRSLFAACRRQLDEHRHIHTGDNLDTLLRTREIEADIAGRVTEHIRKNHDTGANVDPLDRLTDSLPDLARIRIEAIGYPFDAIETADNREERVDHFDGKTPVANHHDSDLRTCFIARCCHSHHHLPTPTASTLDIAMT